MNKYANLDEVKNAPEIRLLEKISSPDDVKKLPEKELSLLSDEIRRVIIKTTLENGGHLASNLGIVEATIALHRVFDCNRDGGGCDDVVFDVGHQAYTHKLLTGRYENFGTLRELGGISGLTNKNESIYDTVTAGHSGASLSTAIGIAEGKNLRANNGYTVAVIGDGSFTNGMIYEALNQLSEKNLRLIVLLNDNEMSISENVGGLSRYLSYIRTSEGYFTFKTVSKKIFLKLPFIGRFLVKTARNIRDLIKRMTNSETWFESLGLEYIGPVDGNNLARLTAVLEEAKTRNCPVVVHMKTKKGLGYIPAEENPSKYHSISGLPKSQKMTHNTSGSRKTYTETVSDALCEYAEKDEKICAITAAMRDGCGLGRFAEMFPERFFDVGIAEEHAVTMASGLSLAGMKPILVLYSTFAQRVFDQLWHDVALQNVGLTLLISHAGIVPGDGVTHQGVYDFGLIKLIPKAEIYAPYNEYSLKYCIKKSAEGNKLSVIRYPKGDVGNEFDGYIRKNGYIYKDFGASPAKTIITYSRSATKIDNILRRNNEIGARHIVIERLHPLPEEVVEIIEDDVYIIDETTENAGIAPEFIEICAENNLKCKIIRKYLPDEIPCGTLDELEKLTGFDENGLEEFIK